jgi:predicted component of type VI protein secretion system
LLGPDHQALLLSALASPLSQLLPPNRQYVARLAKQLIAAAEAAQQELSEELLQLYTAVLMPTCEVGCSR